jgi:hypothetical protein
MRLFGSLALALCSCTPGAPVSAPSKPVVEDAGTVPGPALPRYSEGAYNSLAGAFGRFAGSQLFALVHERMDFYKLRLDGDDPKSPVAIGFFAKYLEGEERNAGSGRLIGLLLSGAKPAAATRQAQVVRVHTTADPPGPMRLVQRSAERAFHVPSEARFQIDVEGEVIVVRVHTAAGEAVHRFTAYGPLLTQAPPESGIPVQHRAGAAPVTRK